MINKTLTLILVIIANHVFAQDQFENGYFITASGEKQECLIENKGWVMVPASFKYKFTETEDPVQKSTERISEFGIYGKYKFEKHTIKVDRSSTENLDEMTTERNPTFTVESTFLIVLVEGKADLLELREPGFSRFYLRIGNEVPRPLVSRKFLGNSQNTNKTISVNDSYKQELFNVLSGEALPSSRFTSLKYENTSLTKLFRDYNKLVSDEDFIEFTMNKDDERNFHVSALAGLCFSSYEVTTLVINNLVRQSTTDFGSHSSIYLGSDLELSLPMWNRKWSLIATPEISFYSAKATNVEMSRFEEYHQGKAKVNYLFTRMEGRRYFMLKDDLSLFLNGGIIISVYNDTSIKFGTETRKDGLGGEAVWEQSYGGGVRWKALEMQLKLQNKIKKNSGFHSSASNLSRSSIIIGYQVF